MVDPTVGLTFDQIPIPHLDMFYEDYVFGTDGTSLKNRLDQNAAPLLVTGDVSFEPANALFKDLNAGLVTTVPRSLYDYTAFTVFQNIYNIPQDGINPPTLPKPGSATSSNVVSWNNGTQFARYLGSNFTYRSPGLKDISTTDAAPDSNSNGYTVVAPSAIYYPDGSVIPVDRWIILVTSSNATDAYFSLENEVPMQTTKSIPHDVTNTPDAVTKLFGGMYPGDTGRMARHMISKYMTPAQMLDVVLYLRRSMRKRTIVC